MRVSALLWAKHSHRSIAALTFGTMLREHFQPAA